jgi:5-methylcytosine-specific restriction protein A
MARTVSEWIGKSDDHRAPGSVRDRILKREPCCHLCSLPIDGTKTWDLDHVVALINGGENRESNLRPAHRKCHVEKTARDVAEKAKIAAVRKKHNGSVRPKGEIPGRGFVQSEKSAERAPKQPLPFRPMFREVTT